jgi:arabinogalactan endo-1,4-beta-galactosidase
LRVLVSALLVLCVLSGTASSQPQFVAGADMSLVPFFESRGVVYQDAQGQLDALEILRNRGLNCVRLRLFTSSAGQAQKNPYNCINNLDYTVPLAQRVKAAGLPLMLDFHYSDTWADPGHQAKPAAWLNLSFPDLVQQVRSYSSNCIQLLKNANALPDYVQIGNEITGGLLWPDGKVRGTFDTPAQWARLGQLLNAAAQGIREGAGSEPPKLIIHIDRGGDWDGTRWFFDNLQRQQVPFDIIGESYYPFWHGPLSSLSRCLTNATQRYQRPIVVAETAFPWMGSTNIYGLPPTPTGQVQFVAALAQVVKGLRGQLGAGIVWWGAKYQRVAGLSLAGFDRDSFFGDLGFVLPVADAMGQLAAPLLLRATIVDGSIQFVWPFSGAGLSLMQTPSLTEPAWTPAAAQIQVTGLSFSTTVIAKPDARSFYRLQSD